MKDTKEITGLKGTDRAKREALITKENFTCNTRQVYLLICDCSTWGSCKCSMSRETMQQQLGIKEKALRKCFNDLESSGYILRVSSFKNYSAENPSQKIDVYPLKLYNKLFHDKHHNLVYDATLSKINSIRANNKEIVTDKLDEYEHTVKMNKRK